MHAGTAASWALLLTPPVRSSTSQNSNFEISVTLKNLVNCRNAMTAAIVQTEAVLIGPSLARGKA